MYGEVKSEDEIVYLVSKDEISVPVVMAIAPMITEGKMVEYDYYKVPKTDWITPIQLAVTCEEAIFGIKTSP